MRTICSLIGTAVLGGLLACFAGCGGGDATAPGIPEDYANMPPPEIPGTKEMEEQLRKKGMQP